MKQAVVSLQNVHKTIKGKEIIRNLSFEVKEGEVYGFLGPNGSGKTTTIRMMTGLISMTSGDITVCGHSIRTERERALAHVGAIVENPELYDYMTGMQNLRHFANMAVSAVTKSRMQEIVKLVELDDAIHQKVKTYSLGMKQRLGIAQALLHNPKVLILDEPTNGLDPSGIRKLRDYLQHLAKEEGIAVLVSSHLLSEVELMCDRVVIIQNGQFVRESSLKESTRTEMKALFEVDRPLEACRLLGGEQQQELVAVAVKREEIPDCVEVLVNEGIRIYGVHVRNETLEEQFLALTEGGTSR